MTTPTAKSSKPGPKPRGPFEDRRETFTTRITGKTKAGLVAAARATDRSLSQEIEFRLERSLAEDETFGGMLLRALFRLFGNAAVIIEQQTGKSCFEDWNTRLAVQAAWRHLGANFGPRPSKEWRQALLEAAKATTASPLELPPEDAEPGVRAAYLTESAKRIAALGAFHRYQEDDRAQEGIGEEIAASLLPETPKKES